MWNTQVIGIMIFPVNPVDPVYSYVVIAPIARGMIVFFSQTGQGNQPYASYPASNPYIPMSLGAYSRLKPPDHVHFRQFIGKNARNPFKSGQVILPPDGPANFLTVTILVIALFYVRHGVGLSEQLAEKNMKTVIPVLERYHQVNGNYPNSVEALTPEYLSQLPRCSVGRMHYVLLKNDSYSFICMTFMFMRQAYDSDTKTWESYD